MTDMDPNAQEREAYRREAQQGRGPAGNDSLTRRLGRALRTLANWIRANPFSELLRALEPIGILVAVVGIWFAVIQTLSTQEALESAHEQTRLARKALEDERPVREMTMVSLAWEALERARQNRGASGQYDALRALRRLGKTDFSDADLSSIDLRQADLRSLEFNRADLTGGLLDRADFTKAGLREAVFGGTSLVESIFLEATLDSTKFISANLAGTRFDNTILNNTTFLGTTLPWTKFLESKLKGGKISNNYLIGTNFSGATLDGVRFIVRNMRQVDFSSATFVATQFDFERSFQLGDVSPKDLCPDGSHTNLRRKFSQVNFKDATLTCHDAEVPGGVGCTSLTFVDLVDVEFEGTNFVGTDVSGTDFRKSRLTQEQVDGMCWSRDSCPPLLPDDLKTPPSCTAE